MPARSLEREVPYSAEQMFDLAIDVEHYKDFMSLKFSAHVIERSAERILVTQSLRVGPMSFSFPSTATFHRPDWIRIESSGGPFSYYLIAWKFTKLAQDCLVHVEVDCATHIPPLAILLAPWMETFSSGLISAFEKRARDIYGLSPAS